MARIAVRIAGLLAVGFLALGAAVAASPIAGVAHAAPAYPVVKSFTQPDGSVVELRLWGDEFIHGWDTLDGYAVVKNPDSGYWVYAKLDSSGNLTPTEAVAGKDAPPTPPGLRPTQPAVDEARAAKGAPPVGEPLAPAPPPWAGADTDVLFIMVRFTDVACSYTAAQMQTNLFGGGASGPGDLDDYYREVSYGALEVDPGSAGVVGCFALASNRDYYDEGPFSRIRDLISDAVTAADPTVDFSDYDNDGDTMVDTLGIIYAGGGPHDGCVPADGNDNLWPHMSSVFPFIATADGVSVGPYVIQSEVIGGACTAIQTIGLFAHEFGHALGLPDLYDIDGSSDGVGSWSVMANQYLTTVNLADTPPHFDAWSKWYEGWITPTAPPGLTITDIALPPIENVPEAIQLLPNPGGPDDWSFSSPGVGEYFLIECRQQIGFDARLPGPGYLIWHIDEARSNNASEGHTAGSHRLVDLEEADGLNELDEVGTRGDAGDPFPGTTGNTLFDDTTTPHARLYSGANSGVSVSGMTANCAEAGPAELAGAMDIPAEKILAASLNGSDPLGVAVQSGSLGNPKFPTAGDTFVILSTGIATDAKRPNDSDSHSTVLGGLDNEQGNDLVQLDLTLLPPEDATCLRFDFAFLSEEYPEWVGSTYNDGFVAEIGGKSFVIIGNQIVSPNNIAFDPTDGGVMDVSSPLAFHPSAGNPKDTGTTYDGATDLLGASTQVAPGEPIQLVFSITDLGDSIFDSAVFLDNFRWTQETGVDCPTGPEVPQATFTVSGALSLSGGKAWIRAGSTVKWICDPDEPDAQVALRFQYPWGTTDHNSKGLTTFTHSPSTSLLGAGCIVDGVEVGKIVINWILIDPSGSVFDTNTGLAVPGATVTLEIEDPPGSGLFRPIDPVTDAALKDPDVNPQTTGLEGRYAWDVAPGTYRVQVDKLGCSSVTSPPVVIPPPVADLDVGIKCTDSDGDGLPDYLEPSTGTDPNNPDTDGDGTPDGDEDPDGDGLTNLQELALGTDPLSPDNVDTDLDGCTNIEELGPDETLGGQRDAANPHDFFDVPLPAGPPGTGTKNGAINIFDAIGVLAKFGTHDNGTPDNFDDDPPNALGQKYNPDFDRTVKGPNAWNSGPPNGVINISDVVRVLAQFGHSCLAPAAG